VGLFSGSATAYSVLVLVGIVMSLIGAFAIKNKKNQAAMGALVLVGGLVSVIFLRVLMYVMGVTMFMLY
jgi:anaerobic dimethyl sulfoxide reductase subunit C (anchor subunit)